MHGEYNVKIHEYVTSNDSRQCSASTARQPRSIFLCYLMDSSIYVIYAINFNQFFNEICITFTPLHLASELDNAPFNNKKHANCIWRYVSAAQLVRVVRLRYVSAVQLVRVVRLRYVSAAQLVRVVRLRYVSAAQLVRMVRLRYVSAAQLVRVVRLRYVSAAQLVRVVRLRYVSAAQLVRVVRLRNVSAAQLVRVVRLRYVSAAQLVRVVRLRDLSVGRAVIMDLTGIQSYKPIKARSSYTSSVLAHNEHTAPPLQAEAT
jgi:hypothetical protein